MSNILHKLGLIKEKRYKTIPATPLIPPPFANLTANTNKYKPIKSPELALRNSIIYRCISIISDSIASIPLDVYRSRDGYWQADLKNSLHNVLSRRASKRFTSYEMLENTIIQMILYGNAYLYIKRDGTYDVSEIILLYPNTTYYDPINDWYQVSDEYNNINGKIMPDNIIHIRNKSIDGLVGKPTIDYLSKMLGIADAVDTENMKGLNTGMRLKGLISNKSEVIGFGEATDNQLSDIRNNIQQAIDEGNDIMALPSGVEFQNMSQSNKDSEINKIKEDLLKDLARFFGIPLSMLGIQGGSGNYQAASAELVNFYVNTLNPILRKIENAFNAKLVSDNLSQRYKIEFDRLSLPYFSDALSNYEKALQLGILSPNDVRKRFNQMPTDGGDEVLISTNLQTVKREEVKNTDNVKNISTDAVE